MCAMLRAHPGLWRTSRLDCVALKGGGLQVSDACKLFSFNNIYPGSCYSVRCTLALAGLGGL